LYIVITYTGAADIVVCAIIGRSVARIITQEIDGGTKDSYPKKTKMILLIIVKLNDCEGVKIDYENKYSQRTNKIHTGSILY